MHKSQARTENENALTYRGKSRSIRSEGERTRGVSEGLTDFESY